MKIKEKLEFIFELITSPFSLIFRSNAVSNPNKTVNIFILTLFSLIVLAVVFFVYYYLYKEVF